MYGAIADVKQLRYLSVAGVGGVELVFDQLGELEDDHGIHSFVGKRFPCPDHVFSSFCWRV